MLSSNFFSFSFKTTGTWIQLNNLGEKKKQTFKIIFIQNFRSLISTHLILRIEIAKKYKKLYVPDYFWNSILNTHLIKIQKEVKKKKTKLESSSLFLFSVCETPLFESSLSFSFAFDCNTINFVWYNFYGGLFLVKDENKTIKRKKTNKKQPFFSSSSSL